MAPSEIAPSQPLDGFAEADGGVERLAAELAMATEWLSSIGIRIERSRLEAYRRDLEGWATAARSDDGDGYWRRVGADVLSNSIFEATEWHEVYRAFGEHGSEDLRVRLEHFVAGPIDYTSERADTSSNSARNYGFELYLGARFSKMGLHVEFGGNGDLAFEFRGHRVFVECKRPQSYVGIDKLIDKAQKQLRRRYEAAADPATSRGLLAVSTTKVVNPRALRLRARTWPELSLQLGRQADEFITRNRRRWKRPRDARTLGVWCEFRCMAWIESGPFLCPSGTASLDYVGPLDSPDRELALSLAETGSATGSARLPLRRVSV